jgi:D-alanyl-lipoteichoic acid acyltransferase DltB (MBOAT superfamily)
MLFNSFVFIGFFIIVYALYLSFRRHYRIQNRILLVASYVFYGYWDWRFLSLIAISTIIDFFVGRALLKSESPLKRKFLLFLSVAANLSLLGFFKYYNFFADSFAGLLGMFGMEAGFVTLNIVLPIGISFYTFQTMSYTIDIYRRKTEPTKNFLDFALFVAFFPQLVAGPIERAVNLLPQITAPRRIRINQLNAGIFLILWGYYKKVVIADNVGRIADQIFNGYTQFQGLDLLIGVLAFTVQILCDFSGYSDIARGLAKVMGFDLMVNFKLPYFALNPSDFWLRWHVSLSSWLRDYLYIPLGGNKKGTISTQRNLAITMLLGGLWHGAAWNFVIWGAFHGLLLALYRVFDKNPAHDDPWNGQHSFVKILSKMLLMFILTLIGWVLFRSSSADQIFYMFSNVFGGWSEHTLEMAQTLLFFSLPLVVIQIYQYIKRDLLAPIKLNPIIRIPLYAHFIIWIIIFGVREAAEFIYFQF